MSTPVRQTESPLAFVGRADDPFVERMLVMRHGAESGPRPVREVEEIVERVRVDGDTALREFARRFDGVDLDDIEVPPARFRSAIDTLPSRLRAALEEAAANIRRFHEATRPRDLTVDVRPGIRLSRRIEPIARAGVYAPGGTAAYPSSVLMGAIPARIAGVSEIVVCSPPGHDGIPSAVVLGAAAIAGVDRVFAVGGAGAIAALAFGTRTVPVVDRIVGPGNRWVAEAKRQVSAFVGTDSPAGPSEILIIADSTADPDRIAAELLAQAEHDPDASSVLITTAPHLVERVRDELQARLRDHPRRDIASSAFRERGCLLLVDTLEQAIDFAARFAPEHLLLGVENAADIAHRIRNAGTIFVGQQTSVAFGDYITGANHVLPTAGLARTMSGLDTSDFVRRVTVQQVSSSTAAELATPTAVLAEAEGLPGHASAARLAGRARAEDRAVPEVRSFRRPSYDAIRRYDPGRRACAVDLSDNTNLFGLSPAVLEVLGAADATVLSRYPSVYGDPLKRAFAGLLGISDGHVVTGCGSDDIIDSAVRAFCEAGDALACPWPTFGVVPMFARMNSVRPIAVPSGDGLTPDVQGLLSSGARMIYLCRPENPSGHLCARSIVQTLIERFQGILLVDEAYTDFSGDSVVDLVLESDNAVVLRTLSKAWGLAGMRVGFAVGPESLVAEIEKSRGPYKVSGLAERCGVATLGDPDFARRSVAETIDNRERLVAELTMLGAIPFPSRTNFLLVPVAEGRADTASRSLRDRGIGVRAFRSLPVLGDCLRVTVGPWSMMQPFLDAFAAIADEVRR